MTDIALVADIGGTNARFGIAQYNGSSISIHETQVFRTADYETLVDAGRAYLTTVRERPVRGCIAAAGPVIAGKIELTNSDWRLSTDDIGATLGLSQVRIVNDFFAVAASVAYLPDAGVTNIKSGAALSDAPQLVLGPGTGFGQALVVPTVESQKVIATEGGHVAFAPQSDEEFEIRKFIARSHPRVSVERLLSGDGLVNIYRAICAMSSAPCGLSQPGEVSAAAAKLTDANAVRALEVFCSVLGRVAGDAVLATGARGGVIFAGGIAPKIQGLLRKSNFIASFTDKGRMTEYISAVPVDLIIADDAALFGAAATLFAGE